MTIQTTEHTLEELYALPGDGAGFELVHGQLVEKGIGFLAAWIASQIAAFLKTYGDEKGVGWTAAEAAIACFDWINHGRRPDVVFFSKTRLPSPLTDEPVRVAPNLVVEVVSKNDGVTELEEKIDEYLRAGVELVWIVIPSTHSVRVHRADGSVAVFHENAQLDAQPVLPLFGVIVRDFFPAK